MPTIGTISDLTYHKKRSLEKFVYNILIFFLNPSYNNIYIYIQTKTNVIHLESRCSLLLCLVCLFVYPVFRDGFIDPSNADNKKASLFPLSVDFEVEKACLVSSYTLRRIHLFMYT